MTEELKPELVPIEDKMTQELVKANVTEAVIVSIREKYLPLKIAGLDDKETYLLVKEGRKECKSLRVIAKKICTNGREEATAIQKAWIAKEKEVTGRIAEVENYLEAQEKEYETGIAAEKEARKRKQEEQLILRQQELTGIGVLYSDGEFSLGDVSFELSAIKESDNDIWNETIWPLYKQAYEAIEADRIEQDRLRKEREAELKREQEELEKKRKELEEKEAELKREEERQAAEYGAKKAAQLKNRLNKLTDSGFVYNSLDRYEFGEFTVFSDDVFNFDDAEWDALMREVDDYVDAVKREQAEQKRKEQERIYLQNKRYAELLPLNEYGVPVEMDNLWSLSEELYSSTLGAKRVAFDRAEEEKAKEIAEKAAKAERERIEEEQRQADIKRVNELRRDRANVLKQYNADFDLVQSDLGEITEEAWAVILTDIKDIFEEKKRKQEEERKAEALAQAGDKEKWNEIMERIGAVEVWPMRSSQYRKKAAILREKLEEIKSL